MFATRRFFRQYKKELLNEEKIKKIQVELNECYEQNNGSSAQAIVKLEKQLDDALKQRSAFSRS